MKLGELLLRENIITPDQLKEALNIQHTYGIRLGSCLVKMGYVEEEKLLQLLSEKLHVPRVSYDELSAAPKVTLNKLTGELVSKYRVFPFLLEGKHLSIAMSNPSDFNIIEEIGFITGCIVTPYIASEIAIAKLLARHYDFTTIDSRYKNVRQPDKTPQVTQKQQTVVFPIKSETGEFINVEVAANFGGFGIDDSSPDSLTPSANPTDIHSPLHSKDQVSNPSPEEFDELNSKFEALFCVLTRKGLVTEQELAEEIWLRKIQSLPDREPSE